MIQSKEKEMDIEMKTKFDIYVGCYINIGLISDKSNFKEKVIKLISSSDVFYCKKVDYQTDNTYSAWEEKAIEQCGIDIAINYCMEFNMAKITGDLKLGEYGIKGVIFQAEELSDGSYCFLIQMPEQQNYIFQNINVAEERIISFFEELTQYRFTQGFCDSEAEAEHEQGYAISVVYNPSANIVLQSWMIDEITPRE